MRVRASVCLVCAFVASGSSAACGGRTVDPTLDATSDAPGAEATADASIESSSDGGACFSDVVTSDWKLCNNDSDCVVAHHQTDCCGSEVAVGVSASAASAYANCEHAWVAHFPGCGCPAAPLSTEDGKRVTDPTLIVVHCTDRTSSGGICKTSS
jgi:hypothetical protein